MATNQNNNTSQLALLLFGSFFGVLAISGWVAYTDPTFHINGHAIQLTTTICIVLILLFGLLAYTVLSALDKEK